jgi:hypothetical protein
MALPTSAQLSASLLLGADHLQPITLSRYRAHFTKYAQLGARTVSDFSLDRISLPILTLYLKLTASKRRNAAALAQIRSAVVTYATRVRGMPPLTPAEEASLSKEVSKEHKRVGVLKRPTKPATRRILGDIFTKLASTFAYDLRAEATWRQLVVAHGCTTRPGELMGRTPLLAEQVTFIPVSLTLPHGAAKLTLRDTKGMHLTGERNPETAMAAGIGGHLCPVAALHLIFDRYGLHDRPKEPVFASTLTAGTRKWTDPDHWTGAAPMTPREFNPLVKALCKAAGVPCFTARATRNGSVVDMATAGVNPLVIMPAGRWRSPTSITPYASMTDEGAAHIAKAFAATPSGQ